LRLSEALGSSSEMSISEHFQPVIEMTELSRFPEKVRRLVISQEEVHGLRFSPSRRDCVLGILRRMLGGLTFVCSLSGFSVFWSLRSGALG
jgi:hypothetical protein